MKSGVIQRWGLVEFSTSSEAEMTQQLLNGHLINGKPIRVQVCSSLIWENPKFRDRSMHLDKACHLACMQYFDEHQHTLSWVVSV